MPFCTSCGHQHQGGKFCPECGAQQPLAAQQPTVMQAVAPPTLDPNAEQTLWEGEAKDLSNMVSGGVVKRAKYRLTTRMLYFERGILSTNAEQVPLWAVRDIDMRQSMTQKVRGVGNVVVHVEHSDYTGRKEVVLENIDQPGHVRDLLNRHAQQERIAYDQRRQTHIYRHQS